MATRLKRELGIWLFGLSLMTLGVAGCGTLTGATVGGAADAKISTTTGSNIGKNTTIRTGIDSTAGAVYDIYNYNRRDRFDDRFDD